MTQKLMILVMAMLVAGLALLARDPAAADAGLEISILSSSPDRSAAVMRSFASTSPDQSRWTR
jgi:hypothetical protein